VCDVVCLQSQVSFSGEVAGMEVGAVDVDDAVAVVEWQRHQEWWVQGG
jgi:hypothetical protein